MSYSDNILQAIDIIASNKVFENNQNNKQAVAQIIGLNNYFENSYLIQYNNLQLIAYTFNFIHYSIGDLVYIMIPNNDFNTKIYILNQVENLNYSIKYIEKEFKTLTYNDEIVKYELQDEKYVVQPLELDNSNFLLISSIQFSNNSHIIEFLQNMVDNDNYTYMIKFIADFELEDCQQDGINPYYQLKLEFQDDENTSQEIIINSKNFDIFFHGADVNGIADKYITVNSEDREIKIFNKTYNNVYTIYETANSTTFIDMLLKLELYNSSNKQISIFSNDIIGKIRAYNIRIEIGIKQNNNNGDFYANLLYKVKNTNEFYGYCQLLDKNENFLNLRDISNLKIFWFLNDVPWGARDDEENSSQICAIAGLTSNDKITCKIYYDDNILKVMDYQFGQIN